MKRNSLIIAMAAVILVLLTASATAYLVQHPEEKPVKTATVTHSHSQPATQVRQQVACDDGNIAGKALGGVGGGVAGSMLGKGNGKTATTIAGTLGGAYIGGETIPLHNVTCR